MDITQGIRARQTRPYPNQQSHTHPLPPRWKAPILTTTRHHQSAKEPHFSLDSPTEITLRVKWEAAPKTAVPVSATCINGEYSYDTCAFYDPGIAQDVELATHGNYQAIALHYQGYGAYRLASKKSHAFNGYVFEDATLTLQDGSLLASQSFQTQTLSPMILRRRLIAEQTWLVTCPHGQHAGQINVTPYYGYGVYAKAGSPLDHIEQVYARLTTHGSRTAVELKRLSALQQQGLAPPFGGIQGQATIIYPSLSHDQPYSLKDAIARGAFNFTLQYGEEALVYKSLRYGQENPHTQCFDMVFVVGEFF